MGVATILEAREIALLATGEHKAAIVKRAVEGDVDRSVAATYLQRHPNATVYLDIAAAAELTRVKTPWLLGEIEWTRALEIEAVVWLSEVTGKSMLKLDDQEDPNFGDTDYQLAAYAAALRVLTERPIDEIDPAKEIARERRRGERIPFCNAGDTAFGILDQLQIIIVEQRKQRLFGGNIFPAD